MARPTPWNDEENAACVALYFYMLALAISGENYNKAALIRAAQGKAKDGERAPAPPAPVGTLIERSRASIEMKLMNCSAAHAKLDPIAVTMDGFGYRAMPNYQAALENAVASSLVVRSGSVAADGGHELRRLFNS